MTILIDPATIEARMKHIEAGTKDPGYVNRIAPDEENLCYLIATCRALLAELARAQKRIEVAEASLRSGGYTYKEGAAAWKPPLGKPPNFAALARARAAVEVAETAEKKLLPALELANGLIYEAMVTHHIYPSVGNKVYIEEAISEARAALARWREMGAAKGTGEKL